MLLETLMTNLRELPSTDSLHNLYADGEDENAELHRHNLERYLLDMSARKPKAMFVLEAPGHRGCARTGIPITSERVMLAKETPFGLFDQGYRLHPEKPNGIAEPSATILWGALTDHAKQPPLLWNTVPLHPHKPDQPRSNRAPKVGEQRLGYPFLQTVHQMFDPLTVLAVGRIAQRACDELNIPYIALRHPSQGGKADFIRGLVAAEI